MSTTIVTILNKTEKYIIERFRNKGAISISTSLCIDEIQIDYGKNSVVKLEIQRLLKRKVIKVIENKYWLDDELYMKMKKRSY